jgi:hypothetical protein
MPFRVHTGLACMIRSVDEAEVQNLSGQCVPASQPRALADNMQAEPKL